MANKDLKWETTITRNIGVDFGFFNSRLTGTIDAYWNTTKDLLMKTAIPVSQVSLQPTPMKARPATKVLKLLFRRCTQKTRDWNVTAGFNINFNRGKVDKLADNVTGLYGTEWATSSTFRNQIMS